MIKRLALLAFVILVVVSAVYALRDQKKVTTSSEKAYKAFLAGRELMYKLYYREAVQEFENAVKLDSNFAMAFCRLAILQRDYFGNKNKADSLIKKAISAFPRIKEKERQIISIVETDTKADYKKGRALRDAFIAKYPECMESHEYLAIQYQEAREYERAIGEYEKILKIDPNDALAYNMMAYLNYFLRNYDIAIDNVKKYVFIAGEQANPHDSYGEILMNVGKYDEAIAQFNEANKIKPDLYFVLMHLGWAYSQIGRLRDAIGYFERAKDNAVNQSQINNCDLACAESYWAYADYDKSFNIATKFLESHPNYIPALGLRGSLAAETGNLALAGDDLKRIDSLLSNNALPESLAGEMTTKERLGLVKNRVAGMIAANQGDYETAITLIREIADSTVLPSKLWQRAILAHIYVHMGNYPKARELYLLNLQDNPNHGLTLQWLAELYGILKQPEEQKETLLRYLSVMSGGDEDLPAIKAARAQLNKLIQMP